MPRLIRVSSIFPRRVYLPEKIGLLMSRDYFTQDCALILCAYTIFSLLLRGGCFGILCLARWWEFLEDPSFPFLGCLHPQVLLHKAVGYYWGKEGGQLGTEGWRAMRKVWWGPDHSLAPAGLAPSALSSSPPPAHGACRLFFPLHPGDCSLSAIYHFSPSFYGQREVFLMYEKVFTVLSQELS